MYGKLITRRQFVRRSGTSLAPIATACMLGQHALAQDRDRSGSKLRVRLVKEFKNATLCDVAPDGKQLCLYFSQNPTRSFVWRGKWEEKSAPVLDGEDALRILDFGSWVQIRSIRLRERALSASFFADGQSLYAETQLIRSGGEHRTQRVLVDIKTGEQEEHIDAYVRGGLNFSYRGLSDRVLLGSGYNDNTAKTDVLVRADAISCQKIKVEPFAWNRNVSTGRTETPIALCDNRKTFAYSFDNTVVYRSAGDLSVLWTKKTEVEPMLWHVGISSDGSAVAATASLNDYSDRRLGSYTAVFDAQTGEQIARIATGGTEAVAISPGKKLLAVGQRVPLLAKKSGTQPTVELFEIASGKNVATVIHDQFYGGGGEFLYAGVTARFTPDGKYLITSGLNTKIWELG